VKNRFPTHCLLLGISSRVRRSARKHEGSALVPHVKVMREALGRSARRTSKPKTTPQA
jgi:hypothetical protein